MKIIHVIISLNVGGAELMLKRLVEGLHNTSNMSHSIITLTELGPIGENLKDLGINVIALDMKNVFSILSIFIQLRKELIQQSPDIVQTWMYHADFLGGLAAKSIGINNVIWNVRNTHLNSRGNINFIFRKFCALLSYWIPREIIYVSNSAQLEHLKSGYTSKKGIVIGNGFNTDKYKLDTKKRAKYRSEMGLESSDFAVFSIGRWAPAKDHQTFINAICYAAEKNNNIKGVLVGRDIELDKFSLTEAQKKHFICLGQQEDIAGLLSSADTFCLHSITEGFPNVLGEAMCIGLPCITTKAGDAQIILANDRFVVDIKNYKAIAELIIDLDNTSISNREVLGKQNRKRISEFFSLDIVLNKYIDLYKK